MEYPNGFPTFAAYIASDPELAIYRSFNSISARNLLYLQAELIELEAKLHVQDKVALTKEAEGDMDFMLSSRCWETFASNARRVNSAENERMELLKKVRAVLKEYRGFKLIA